MIVWASVHVVLNMTVVDDDWHFEISDSYCQQQSYSGLLYLHSPRQALVIIIIPTKIYDRSPGFKPSDLLQLCTNIIQLNFSAMATLGTEEILLAVEKVQHHGRFRNRRQFKQSAFPESCSQLHKRPVDSFHNLCLNCLNCFLLQK